MISVERLRNALGETPLALELLLAVAGYRQDSTVGSDPLALGEGLLIGIDDIVHAQQLALTLAPLGLSLAGLFRSHAVVAIQCRSDEEAGRARKLLVAAADVLFSRQKLENDEPALPLIAAIEARGYRVLLADLLAAAFRNDSLAICFLSPLSEPDAARNVELAADMVLDLTAISARTVENAFRAVFNDVPAGLHDFTGFEELDADKVVAAIRPSRAMNECFVSLQRCLIPPTPKPSGPLAQVLEDAAGYGDARAWGVELARDYAFWREGRLAWDAIPDRGVLLSGAPGTGKSTFPVLVANTLGAPLIKTSVAEWNAHKNLSGALEQMEEIFAAAGNSGGILFIDELDGISRRDRGEDQHRTYWDQIINHLLTLVSEALRVPGVIIIGATNHPHRIDPALLRAGRIERHVHIELPDAVDRRQIIAHYTGGVLSAEQLTELSELTPQYSGADLESLTRRASAAARRQERNVSYEDVIREVERPLEGLSSSDLRRATIYASGRSLVAEILNVRVDNRPAYPTLVDLRDQLAVLVAGRLAEEMLLGHASVLGEDDLAQASAVAEAIELRLGFGARGLFTGRVRGSESDVRCIAHIEGAADRSMQLLADNRDELERRCSLGVPLPKTSQKPWEVTTVH